MADKKEPLPRVSDRALELVMHDMLDGMLELSLASVLTDGGSLQFVETPSTTPRTPDQHPGINGKSTDNQRQAKIIPFPPPRRSISKSS